ncbi:MAG TPA: hypothetical protein VGE42_01025, partial [Candidatus Dormibacteraeota bacterium]
MSRVSSPPAAKAAAAMARPACWPASTSPRRATRLPRTATPTSPPTCRAALTTPEATAARSSGAASTTALVAAGMVKAIPNPVAAREGTSS